MKFRTAALLLAALVAAGILAAQQTERRQKGPRPGDDGVSPEGVAFQMPKGKPIALREVPPLRVERFEVHELAEGTHAGRPGDLLLTFHGQGFLATSKSPTVRLASGEVLLDDTMMDFEGTRLFVVIPREMRSKLARLKFEEILVVNPGGGKESKHGRFSVKAKPDDLLRPAEGAPRARLVYEAGQFVRSLAEE